MEKNQTEQIAFEQLTATIKLGELLLASLRVEKIVRAATLNETFYQILSVLDSQIISDVSLVAEKIMSRYKAAPIGVPETNLALFHTSNASVNQPFFGIYDLDEPLPIIGMDQKPMALRRMLLMLAPDDLSKEEQVLLGCISSSIIENDLNTEIYQNGNLLEIKQLLSTLFVREIQTLGGES